MAKEKKQNNIVRNMMIALVGGLVVGLGFMLLKQQMSEGTWNVINALLFQDITADQGFHSIGLFYIIGQLFMRGLQMAIVPLVLVSLSLAMCSISSSSKLGRIAGRTLLGFFFASSRHNTTDAAPINVQGIFSRKCLISNIPSNNTICTVCVHRLSITAAPAALKIIFFPIHCHAKRIPTGRNKSP